MVSGNKVFAGKIYGVWERVLRRMYRVWEQGVGRIYGVWERVLRRMYGVWEQGVGDLKR
jgi:hypothetical protein